MKNFLSKMIAWPEHDSFIEGLNAHEYTDEKLRNKIKEDYDKKYSKKITPITEPSKFDPLNPPDGWAYDPFYEIWIETR